ncbi:MAG: heavy metal translocating P-type ATPase, partial [Anaerolineae bacterium]|nr:heavy metal translocating P-type ATPase [Anaerolineae bacterium]
MKTDFERFRLNNLDCADCAARLESGLKQMKGVNFASVNFATATLVIDAKDHAAVFDFIRREEPEVEVEALGEGKGREREIPWKQIGILSASLILFVFGMTQVSKWHGGDGEIWEWLVFGAAYLLSGWRVLASAVRRLANRNWFDESFLMSIATLGAIAIHELPEAVGVMLFYKAGEVIQEFSLEGARDSIRALMSVKAVTAQVVENGKTRPTAPEDVDVGAKIIVPPGEKVPLDGVVLEGRSEINQAALTGESLPAAVEPGDEVYAGVVNLYSQLTVEVTKRYEDSAAARLLALVEEAGNRKAKTEKFITRFANYYTPIIVGLAGLLAFVPPLVVPGATLAEWAYRALVLLVIACPCALMISIPLGYFGGVGGASRRGILVKGANYLDVLAQVRTVVFDKTGTLTRGRFAVIEVVPQNGYAPEELLRIANEVERASNHPIAASIRLANHHAGEVKAARDFEELPGLGVRAEFDGYTAIAGNDEMMHRYAIEHEICEPGGTAVHVAVDDRYAGFVRLADEVKADSQEGIAALHKLGVEKVMML